MSRWNSRRTEPGFSLAELIISLGVIATISLVVFAMFLQLIRGTEKQSNLVAGTILAEEIMTERLQVIFDDAEPGLTKDDFFSTNSPPALPLQGTTALGNNVYTYEMTHQTLVDTAGVLLGGPAANNNRIKRVDITIWWWTDTPGQARQGHGHLRTEASRLVNEKLDYNV